MTENFDSLKQSVQEIIDAIAEKDFSSANARLVMVSEQLDEILDHAETDEDLVEVSKYQVLLNQLHQKIQNS